MIEDTEDTTEFIEISNTDEWIKFNKPQAVVDNDPFKIDGEELKKVTGLGATFRRKMARDLQKRFVGQDGSQTQQNLVTQAITGYGLFDLVEPQFNLYSLSKAYEISPYNYSAINAKVANIVGLGYSFVETRKANDMLDEISDVKQLARARKKLLILVWEVLSTPFT